LFIPWKNESSECSYPPVEAIDESLFVRSSGDGVEVAGKLFYGLLFGTAALLRATFELLDGCGRFFIIDFLFIEA
jgi:hypothetical protein